MKKTNTDSRYIVFALFGVYWIYLFNCYEINWFICTVWFVGLNTFLQEKYSNLILAQA